MHYRVLFFSSLLLFITACGDNESAPRPGNSENTITVSDIGATINISDVQAPDSVDINITGNNNTVSVINNTSVGKLSVTGTNNLINIETGVTINICVLDGSDNTLSKPSSLFVTCTIEGLGNSVMNF